MTATATANEDPGTWDDWKLKHPQRFYILAKSDWMLRKFSYWSHGSPAFRFLEVAGWVAAVLAVVAGVITWILEADDRVKEKHYRAWELINSARESTGDGGRRDALRDLHEDNVDLSAAPLSRAYLARVDLSRANLTEADLSAAVLTGANLSHARLGGAKLIGASTAYTAQLLPFPAPPGPGEQRSNIITSASVPYVNLSGTYLEKADLTDAKLNWANLREANLKEADLSVADLTRADLSKTKLDGTILLNADLTEAKLENAKFCKTIMPDGTLNNHDCPPEAAPPNPSETPPAPN